MSDHTQLLNQLRLDRPQNTHAAPSRRRIYFIVAAAVFLTAGGMWVAARSDTAIKVATAQSLSSTSAKPAAILDASGYVVARRQATVSSKLSGKLERLLIEEGQSVSEGQVIAELDDTNVVASLAQLAAKEQLFSARLITAQTALSDATPFYRRSEALMARHHISQAEFDTATQRYHAAHSAHVEAQKALEVVRAELVELHQQQRDLSIRAPFSGVVTEKAAQPGEIVSPFSAGGGFVRTGIGTIVDMDSLEVEVEVNENYISRIYPKQPAEIVLNAYPDWRIPGQVIVVVPSADRAKASVKVRIALQVKDSRIIPDLGARVSFHPEKKTPAESTVPGVAVQSEAIINDGVNHFVFVVNEGRVERRAVKIGGLTDDGRRTIVLAGLNDGSRVAISHLNELKDGSAIRLSGE